MQRKIFCQVLMCGVIYLVKYTPQQKDFLFKKKYNFRLFTSIYYILNQIRDKNRGFMSNKYSTSISFLMLILLTSLHNSIRSEASAFIAKENNHAIISEGDCTTQHSPFCSFNIAISLMGFNENILIDEQHPEIAFKKGYVDYFEIWKQSHDPLKWMLNSCLWFSHWVIQERGYKKLENYVALFDYGNMNVSGTKGKNDSLTHSWLSGGSLKISPDEQTIFLQKFLDRRFQINPQAYEMTKNIIFIDDLIDGWKLYGKAGTGRSINTDGTFNQNYQDGSHVGWIEKENRSIVFASYVEQTEIAPAGGQAKAIARAKLIDLISMKMI